MATGELEPFDLGTYRPPKEKILKRLRNLGVFYFGLKNQLWELEEKEKSKDHFVSIKGLATFKKVKEITNDWRDLAYALRSVDIVELNAAGNMARRKEEPSPQANVETTAETVVTVETVEAAAETVVKTTVEPVAKVKTAYPHIGRMGKRTSSKIGSGARAEGGSMAESGSRAEGEAKLVTGLKSQFVNGQKEDTGNDFSGQSSTTFGATKRKAEEEEKWKGLPPVKKDFHREESEIATVTDEDAEKYRLLRNNIAVGDLDGNQKPIKTSEQAFMDYPSTSEQIRHQNFEVPSPIQSQGWPIDRMRQMSESFEAKKQE